MKNNHGGKRLKSGRKKIADKAIQLNIYPKGSIIKNVGGPQRAKEIAMAALLKEAGKLNLDKTMKKDLVNSN